MITMEQEQLLAAFSAGGNGYEARTEEWNVPDFQIKTVTTS